jgi:hypothetical protein
MLTLDETTTQPTRRPRRILGYTLAKEVNSAFPILPTTTPSTHTFTAPVPPDMQENDDDYVSEQAQ